jgi:hypothetical protein
MLEALREIRHRCGREGDPADNGSSGEEVNCVKVYGEQ